jgi:hypothetical protein
MAGLIKRINLAKVYLQAIKKMERTKGGKRTANVTISHESVIWQTGASHLFVIGLKGENNLNFCMQCCGVGCIRQCWFVQDCAYVTPQSKSVGEG